MTMSLGPNTGLLVDGALGEQHFVNLMAQFRGHDALIQCHVKDKDLATPPGSPANGDMYIVAGSPTGAWSGQAGKLAYFYVIPNNGSNGATGTSGWQFFTAKKGWRVHVEDENVDYQYNGAAWVVSAGGGFTGGTLTSALNEAPPVTLASAATVNIGAAAANTINITGTTTITAFDTIAAGAKRTLIFGGALTLTHNATSLILPGGASITTAAGDVAEVESLGSGNWKCLDYQRASGLPVTPTGQMSGFRNTIINGKMEIAQRGTSFATPSPGVVLIDRWTLEKTSTGVASVEQSTDVPASNEFQFSLRATVTTADATVDAGDVTLLRQRLEGYDIRDLVGRTFTFSFWVRSSKTGTHCVAFKNQPAPDRSYVVEYTINAANTWEKKSVTVVGGLTSAGTWNYTNGVGLQVDFAMMSGSTFQTTAGAWQTGNFQSTSGQVNVMDTVGNIFAITGVQLEPGSIATPFEHRLIATELSLCQRYFQKSFPLAVAPAEGAYSGWLPGFAWSTTGLGVGLVLFPTRMRTAPTVTFYRPSVSASPSGQWAWYNGSSYVAATTTLADGVAQDFGLSVTMTTTGAVFGQAYIVRGNWAASAEL